MKRARSGKKWVGIIFLFIGFIMLSRQLGVFVPDWVISWPMALIGIGLITGSKHRFRNPGSFILLLVGGIFLLDEIFENIELNDFAWPLVIMAIGLYLIVGKRHHNFKQVNADPKSQPKAEMHDWDKRVYEDKNVVVGVSSEPTGTDEEKAFGFEGAGSGNVSGNATGNATGGATGDATSDATGKSTNNTTGNTTGYTTGRVTDYTAGNAASDASGKADRYEGRDRYESYAGPEDYLDTVSVFGGVKKNIVSKNFRGGEITTIMGGAEINLIQSDIHGTVILDVTQLFGGTKIIVPQQWKISAEMVALFGGIEDRRPVMPGAIPSDEKVLVIKGTSIFGGIDIRSY